MAKYTFENLLEMLEAEDIILDVDFASLNHSMTLKDQGIDSVDLVSILFGVENYFHIKIGKDAIATQWNTIDKILDNLNNMQ